MVGKPSVGWVELAPDDNSDYYQQERPKYFDSTNGVKNTSLLHACLLYTSKLYNFVMRISKGDSYLAEEIVQAVFIKVWEGKESLDPGKSFGAYLCTIAKNQLVNIYQHRMLERCV